MDKLLFLRLWDLYNGLLTPTQQEITDLYFNKDLTLSEIAEEKGITRQGVSECLKACKKQLKEYEDKLHFSAHAEDYSQEAFRLADLSRWAEEFLLSHPECGEEIARLNEIIEKDYSRGTVQEAAARTVHK